MDTPAERPERPHRSEGYESPTLVVLGILRELTGGPSTLSIPDSFTIGGRLRV